MALASYLRALRRAARIVCSSWFHRFTYSRRVLNQLLQPDHLMKLVVVVARIYLLLFGGSLIFTRSACAGRLAGS